MSPGIKTKIQNWHLQSFAEASAARAAIAKAIAVRDYSLTDLVMYVCLGS